MLGCALSERAEGRRGSERSGGWAGPGREVDLWLRVDGRWCLCRQRVFGMVAAVANIACDKAWV